MAEATGRCHGHQHGCPAKARDQRRVRISLDARSRITAITLIEGHGRCRARPGNAEMRLGWDDQIANAPGACHRRPRPAVSGSSLCMGAHDVSSNKGAPMAAVRPVSKPSAFPSSSMRHHDVVEALAALDSSGVPCVMIGRGAQGRPCVSGPRRALSRHWAVPTEATTRRAIRADRTLLRRCCRTTASASHAPCAQASGWALDAAAAAASMARNPLKAARRQCSYVDAPCEVRRRLAGCYEPSQCSRRMKPRRSS